MDTILLKVTSKVLVINNLFTQLFSTMLTYVNTSFLSLCTISQITIY